jgi:GLPGLI family protein
VYLEETVTSIQINSGNAVNSKSNTMKKQMVLMNTRGESTYIPIVSGQENETVPVNEESGIQITMMGGDVKVYKNQKDNVLLSEEYILDRKFLIKDTLINFSWSLSNEEQEINGYKCKKATAGQTTAWYCPEIPVNDGPYIFWGLPGLIIKLQHQNKTVTVTEINLSDSANRIEIPTEGEKVSREKFNEIMMKKMRGRPADQNSINVEIIQR